jgi:hypothetical protein
MPIQVNIQNGDVTGGTLTRGASFEWYNPTNIEVTLSGCGGFCTSAVFAIQPNSRAAAQILLSPPGPFTFTDPAWTAPGMPHISNPPAAEEAA